MMMRRVALLIVLFTVAGCGLHEGERTIDVDIDTPAGMERLRIVQGSGAIELTGSDQDRITGTARVFARGLRDEDHAEEVLESVRIVHDMEGSEGVLRVDMPEYVGISSLKVVLDLRVPRSAVVDIDSADDEVTLTGVRVGAISGVNARVGLSMTEGEVNVSTSNQPVTLQGHHGNVTVATTNASVRMRNLRGSVTVQTTHAPIDIVVSPDDGGAILLQTVGGDIHLGLPVTFGASFLGEARAGRVSIGEVPIRRMIDEPDRVQGQIGDGEGRIRLFTMNGNIAVNGIGAPEE